MGGGVILPAVQREGQPIWGPCGDGPCLEGGANCKGVKLRSRFSPHVHTDTGTSSTPDSQLPLSLPVTSLRLPPVYASQPRYMENKLLYSEKMNFEDSSRLCPRHPLLLMWSSHPSYLLLSQDSSFHLHARSHRHLKPQPFSLNLFSASRRFKPEI